WSFEVEPYSIRIPGDTIAVTASSASNEFSGPEKTLDGSGLGADGSHGMTAETIWFTAAVDLDPWIQYDFGSVRKLDTMLVWNSNGSAEMAIGWGVKDVIIEYSVDGENWDVLADASQFSRAPGSPTYSQYDTIDFGGAAAKHVRLNIQSNWGGILMSYSLSEVQFMMIPAVARSPKPTSGSVDLSPDAIVTWRAGRGAVQHTIYMGTDQNEVAVGLAPSSTSSTHSLDLATLDLELGQTYYWRVDEVNEAESPSVWAGPVWSFSLPASLVVDDFEGYGDLSPNRPFQTWSDGFGYSADEFFPVASNGNGTGAAIGHDIWTLSSPHFDGSLMETVSTLPGSTQSMPFYYGNAGSVASKTQRVFSEPQDWAMGGAKTLSIAFRGQAGNTGTLFAMINNVKIPYTRSLDGSLWHYFNIDLASVNTNLQSVTQLEIGVDGSGASGVLLIDDISLYPDAGPADPGSSGLPLVAWVSFHGDADMPSGGAAGAGFSEAPDKAYTDLLETNGYEVIRYVTTNTPDPEVLNAMDLVIISRSVASGGYQNDGATAWNSIATPMIIASGYTTRSSRMGFTTGTTMVDTTGDITLTVNAPSHPIFAGIDLANGTMVNPFASVAIYPTDGTLARGISVNNDPLNADGTLLATVQTASDPTAGGMVIGEWQAGATLTHDGGAGTDTLAGHRLVFLTGAREASGVSSETAGLYDLYEDGAQIFLNAVEYML
ncbi:MAG: discoidin domain-containing protein, partial [Phycisphaeraceae bacterium]|nr:discoidin domain-containing protein [Phycisphaeraceae bacterium]